jgi:hypothetical protein
VAENPHTAIPIAQPTGVAIDLPCFFCGYNLRTLAVDGVCPECGRPVQHSFCEGWQGWLIFADKPWLGRLRKGITIILWMLLASVVCGILTIPVGMATAFAGKPPDLFWLRVLTIAFGLASTIVWLWSIWLLTSPEPCPDGSTRQSDVATWIRTLSIISLPLSLGYMLIFGSTSEYGQLPSDRGWASGLLMMLSGCVSWTVFLLTLIHMRRLARRDFKKGLGKLMSFIIWGYGVAAVLTASFLVFTFMFMPAMTLPPNISTTQGFTTPVGPGIATSTSFSTTSYAIQIVNPVIGQGSTSTMPAATSMPAAATSMPGTTTTMPAGMPPGLPFGRNWFAFMFLACGLELLFLAWMACGLIALFWFRGLFAKAILHATGPGVC